MVVLHHAIYQVSVLKNLPASEWQRFAADGVDIFFIISGLIMVVTTAGKEISPLEFLKRRLLRIVPLYWAVTLFVAAASLAAPLLLANTQFDAGHLAASLLFLPWPHPLHPEVIEPVVIPGWTLNYEMFFYALFAVSLFWRSAYVSLAVVVGLCGLVMFGRVSAAESTMARFYSSPILLEFGFGVLLGLIYVSGRTFPRVLALGALLLGIVLLTLSPAHSADRRVIFWGVPAAMIVFGAVFAHPRRTMEGQPLLLLIGAASYSIYLIHVIVLAAFRTAWRVSGLPIDGIWTVVFAVAAVLCSLLGGVIVYLLFERPVSALLHGPPRALARQSAG